MRPTSHIELTEVEIKTLEEAVKNHGKATARKRAQCILLNYRGYRLQELSEFFEQSRHTVGNWLINWKKEGISSLQIRPGRGRKAFLKTISVEEKKN